jgi:hypothetical protein
LEAPGFRRDPSFSTSSGGFESTEPPFSERQPSRAPPALPPIEKEQPAAAHRAEPSFDLGVVPNRREQEESDLDFPAGISPAFDRAEMSRPVPVSPPEIVAADRVARSREKRRPFAAFFVGAALLSLLAIGVVFAFQTGLFKSPLERDTSVPNPPPPLESEDFDPAAESGAPALSDQPPSQQDWLAIYTPANADGASAPGDASMEAMQDDSGAFLRIRSGESGSAIIFDVPRDILTQLAGKRAVFSILARAEGGQETEISVECNFGELGDCGRRRYEVGYERGEYLFEVDLPAGQPGANGTIAINSDFSGQGKAIDIYEVNAAVE